MRFNKYIFNNNNIIIIIIINKLCIRYSHILCINRTAYKQVLP